MLESIVENEPTIRLSFFLSIFGLMALLELLVPRRSLTQAKGLRWANNILLVVLNTLVLRVLFPTAAVGMSLLAAERGWGLLNHFPMNDMAAVVITVVVLDFFIYLQHVMVHAIPVLWRLHRVHHADLDYDVTTGARFHPIEIGPVHARQICRDRAPGSTGGGRADFRSAPQCHGHV